MEALLTPTQTDAPALSTDVTAMIRRLGQCKRSELIAALLTAATGFAAIRNQQENGQMFSDADAVELARTTDNAIDLFTQSWVGLVGEAQAVPL